MDQPKDHNQIKISKAISEFLKGSKLGEGLLEHSVKKAWYFVAGKMVEKHTKWVQLKGKTLSIGLDSSVIRQEMEYQKTEILAKINGHLGAKIVHDLQFK